MTTPHDRPCAEDRHDAPPRPELEPHIDEALDRLDQVVQRLEEHPEPGVQEDAVDLLHCVDLVHRSGLRRIADLLTQAGLVESALDVAEIRLLFELYQLGQEGERARAASVIDALRPYVEAQGGHLEVLDAEGQQVKILLSGARSDAKRELRRFVEESLTLQLGGGARLDVVEDLPMLP